MKNLNWNLAILISVIIASTSFAGGQGISQKEVDPTNSDWSLVQKSIACSKSCAAPFAGAFTSVVGFMGFAGASCSAGVCPMMVATGAGGLFTATGLGAALTTLVASAGEACEEGLALQCGGYIVIPAIIGGISGYLVVKGYDKARKWYLHRQQQNQLEETPSNDVVQFVPEEHSSTD